MISNFALQKLVDHNFIDINTKCELEKATQNLGIKVDNGIYNLKQIIDQIQKYELDHPLGMEQNCILSVMNGQYFFEEKYFKFYNNTEVTYTLEELIEYYKLLNFLQGMNL